MQELITKQSGIIGLQIASLKEVILPLYEATQPKLVKTFVKHLEVIQENQWKIGELLVKYRDRAKHLSKISLKKLDKALKQDLKTLANPMLTALKKLKELIRPLKLSEDNGLKKTLAFLEFSLKQQKKLKTKQHKKIRPNLLLPKALCSIGAKDNPIIHARAYTSKPENNYHETLGWLIYLRNNAINLSDISIQLVGTGKFAPTNDLLLTYMDTIGLTRESLRNTTSFLDQKFGLNADSVITACDSMISQSREKDREIIQLHPIVTEAAETNLRHAQSCPARISSPSPKDKKSLPRHSSFLRK